METPTPVLEEQLKQGDHLFRQGDFTGASQAYFSCIQLNPALLPVYLQLLKCLLMIKESHLGREVLRVAGEVFADEVKELVYFQAAFHTLAGKYEEAARALDQLLEKYHEYTEARYFLSEVYRGQGRWEESRLTREAALCRDPNCEAKWQQEMGQCDLVPRPEIPGIKLIALPRSASTFVLQSLGKGLNSKFLYNIDLSAGFFPGGRLTTTWVHDFLHGGVVARSHVASTEDNLAILAQFCPKVVLLIRDPRDAAISYGRLTEFRWHQTEFQITKRLNRIPENYRELSKPERLDIMFDRFFAPFAEWLLAWLRVVEEAPRGIEFLVVNLKDLKSDKHEFFSRILDFYGIPRGRFTYPNDPAPDKAHFPTGDKRNWERVLNDQQKQKADKLMSDPIFQRFGLS